MALACTKQHATLRALYRLNGSLPESFVCCRYMMDWINRQKWNEWVEILTDPRGARLFNAR